MFIFNLISNLEIVQEGMLDLILLYFRSQVCTGHDPLTYSRLSLLRVDLVEQYIWLVHWLKLWGTANKNLLGYHLQKWEKQDQWKFVMFVLVKIEIVQINIIASVLWKMQNLGSHNRRSMFIIWVVCLSSGCSINLLSPWNQLETTNMDNSECCPSFQVFLPPFQTCCHSSTPPMAALHLAERRAPGHLPPPIRPPLVVPRQPVLRVRQGPDSGGQAPLVMPHHHLP